jgi:hypothetical protein
MHGEMCRLRADPTIVKMLSSHYDEVASELNIGKDSRSVPYAVRTITATERITRWRPRRNSGLPWQPHQNRKTGNKRKFARVANQSTARDAGAAVVGKQARRSGNPNPASG